MSSAGPTGALAGPGLSTLSRRGGGRGSGTFFVRLGGASLAPKKEPDPRGGAGLRSFVVCKDALEEEVLDEAGQLVGGRFRDGLGAGRAEPFDHADQAGRELSAR